MRSKAAPIIRPMSPQPRKILLGVTGGFVAGSIVTLLFTDFGGERLTPSAALDQHGGMLGLKGRF